MNKFEAKQAAAQHPEIKKHLDAGWSMTGFYEYQNENGNPIYWRIRLDPPNNNDGKWIRPFYFDGSDWVLKEPRFEHGKKPIYLLPNIKKYPEDIIYIVEGEKCADALSEHGIITTTSGSATSASNADWSFFAGRQIIIWPDNDEQGAVYADNVARILLKLGCKVLLVDITKLNLPPKGDCYDWLAANSSATKQDIENLPLLQTPNSKSQTKSEIAYRCIADIKAKPIDWLWKGRIALGKVTIIAGNPGLGKSQVTVDIAAIVTTGGLFPADEIPCSKGKVIFLSAEDDAADTIRPRLEAVGADLSGVFIIDSIIKNNSNSEDFDARHFSLKTDLKELDKFLGEIKEVRVIVIDPITAYLGGTDSHKNAEVRALLTPLAELASKHNVAVICISHLSKNTNGDALARVTGSLAFVAAARAAFIVAQDPNDNCKRLFLPMKNNIGRDTTGFAFKIESHELSGGIETSKIVWSNEIVTLTANEAMAIQNIDDDRRSVLEDAKEFLSIILANNEMPAKQIFEEARNAGYKEVTVNRAKKEIGVVARRDGYLRCWFWSLPTQGDQKSQGDHEKSLITLGNIDHLRKIKCADCANFKPDTISNGAGIGECLHGDSYQKSFNNMPLYPNVLRKCTKFQPLSKESGQERNTQCNY